MKTSDPIRIGVSACLLGQKVRYDGGHKRDDFLTDLLARFVEFVPLCPELELGLGVPRESIHLAIREGAVRLVAPKSGRDLTDDMRRWASKKLDFVERQGLSGFVLKKGSPSCGMERVKIHGTGSSRSGVGLFAAALMERCPLLPVEEEGRLTDARLRENFIERVFAHHRWAAFVETARKPGDLVRFHTSEKLLLMAHQPTGYAALGRQVAQTKSTGLKTAMANYGDVFMATLRVPVTARRHVNVLQHAAGYFRDRASLAERRELAGTIDEYRRGLLPLVAPITLLRSLVRVHAVDYLAGQTYLSPHPKELMIRNHV